MGDLHRLKTCSHEYRCAKCGKVEAKTFRLGPSETVATTSTVPSDLVYQVISNHAAGYDLQPSTSSGPHSCGYE